ncbi:MAG: MlaD family protein [bacterium]
MSRKHILLLEIFIWIIVLGGLLHLGVSYLDDKFNQGTTYQFEFNDADSVIVGSPVRIMGITVGNVTEVQNKDNNKALISIKINNNDVEIPPSSAISVQFTGLAGSRSIEIIPPNKLKEKTVNPLNVKAPEQTTHIEENNFKVVEPVRVGQVFDLQKDVSLSVLDLSTNILKTFGSGGIEKLENNIVQSKTISHNINTTFRECANAITNIGKQKVPVVNTSEDNINESNQRLESFANELDKAQTLQNIYILSDYSNLYSNGINDWREKHLMQVINSAYQAKNISSSWLKHKKLNSDSINYTFFWINSTFEQIDVTSNNLSKSISNKKIQKLNCTIQNINCSIKKLKNKL